MLVSCAEGILEAERKSNRETESLSDELSERDSAAALAETAAASETEWATGRSQPRIVREGEVDEGPDPMIGQVLSGLYKVDKRIGEGGMGTVYMAVHIHLNKPFAVKVLSDKVAANKLAVDRLLQEAQTASSIDHDNIVDVVSFDTTDEGRVFLVMEFLEGFSLADLVEKGPMAADRVLPIAYQLCQALEAAHERGIVHRDLKPENIFIVRKRDLDFVKVLDFGISKVKTAEAEQVRMTRTGQLVGTPLYMSPEQARGESDVDRHADIYALGVILYEMLCGRPPFEGGNYFQLLWKHGNEEPKPLSERIAIAPELDAVVMKALEKKPEDRHQSMAELEQALMAAAPEIGVHPSRLVSMPPRTAVARSDSMDSVAGATLPKKPSMLPWIGTALALVVAVVALMWSGEQETSETIDGDPTPTTETMAEAPMQPTMETTVETTMETAMGTAMEAMPVGAVPVQVAFVSTPTGARVEAGDTVLCPATPCEVDLPPESVAVTFRKRGYRPATLTFTPDGSPIAQTLRRRTTSTMMTGSSLPSIMMDF